MFKFATIAIIALISNTSAISLSVYADEDAQVEEEGFAQVDTLQMARLLNANTEDEDADRALTAD